MPVFKLCLKIIQKNLPAMAIYVVIFLAISAVITATNVKAQKALFSQAQANVALISEEDTPLTEGFRRELAKNANFVQLPDEKEKLQDALYFRSVTYILRIPKGFTEDFLRGGSMQLQKTVVPGSVENAYIDLAVNQYWNTARLYVSNEPGITQQELVGRLKADLNVSTPVKLKTQAKAVTDNSFAAYYFNFLAYTLSAVLILGVSAIMLVFNNKDLSRRNFCSPIGAGRINFEFILANLLFTAVCWIIMVGFCFVFDPKGSLTQNMVYFLLNSLAFTFCLSGVSYLIGSLLKDRNAISAVCNVVTLGPCFISGVFVPQELLNATVLKIATFTPTYWYVLANNRISALTDFGYANLFSVYSCMLVEFGFALAFFAASLAVGKKKRMSS